jgi:hypothetical protein
VTEIDKARLELRESLRHLFKVIVDAMPDDVDADKEKTQYHAEATMDCIVDAEIVMVQNGVV